MTTQITISVSLEIVIRLFFYPFYFPYTKNEELLTQALTDENKKLFLEYVNAWGVVNGESSADSFAVGFRLGAAFVYDTFVAGSIPNSGDSVCTKEYAIGHYEILGYGVPAY